MTHFDPSQDPFFSNLSQSWRRLVTVDSRVDNFRTWQMLPSFLICSYASLIVIFETFGLHSVIGTLSFCKLVSLALNLCTISRVGGGGGVG